MGTKQKRKPHTTHQHPTAIGLVIGYALVITLTAAVTTFYALQRRSAATTKAEAPFTTQQIAASPFTLYYPTKLPDSLHIDSLPVPTTTTPTDANIVNLRITDGLGSATNRSLTINEQRTPPDFNLDTFTSGMDNKQPIQTKYGQATVGTINLGQTRLAILVTNDHTLLFVQIGQGVSTDDVTHILQHLKAATPSS